MKRLLCFFGLLGFLVGFKPQSGSKENEQFKPHMRAVYHSLMTIFPFALNKNAFSDGKNAKLIGDSLNSLSVHATQIEHLASQEERGHAFLSRQLERNAQLAASKFKARMFDQSHFFVEEIYDTCLSCHTSRGSDSDSAFTFDFTRDAKWEAMGPFGKAKFLALSRQFESALEEYERLFASADVSLEDILHYDPFVDYMLLALRVKDERDRVIKTFSSLLNRSYPSMIKKDLEVWIKVLKAIKAQGKNQNGLDYARGMIKAAKDLTDYPRDRSGLVYYIYASRTLREFLKAKDLKNPLKAEAYYALGICEMGIGVPFLSVESGLYFEEAIRLQPKSSLSKKAYHLYEENLLFGYSGSSGTYLPDEEKKKLDELKQLAM